MKSKRIKYYRIASSEAQDIVESCEVCSSSISGPPGHSRIPSSALRVSSELYSLFRDVGNEALSRKEKLPK